MAFLTNLTAGTQSGGRISDLMVYETNRTGPNDYACVQFLPRRSCTSAALAIDRGWGGGVFLNWKPIMRMISIVVEDYWLVERKLWWLGEMVQTRRDEVWRMEPEFVVEDKPEDVNKLLNLEGLLGEVFSPLLGFDG